MTYGPVDFIALEFKGNQFKGEIMPALLELVNNGIVRVIDIVIVQKDADGNISMQEMQQHDKSVLELFDPQKAEVTGLIQLEDLKMIGETLVNNTTAGILLFENLWAVKFKEAVFNANGRVLMQTRIPHEVVLETLDAISTTETDAVEVLTQ